jgi:hypothetical protein
MDANKSWIAGRGKAKGSLGGKVRAVWVGSAVSGSFAALRVTAKTDNGRNRSRSACGMTTSETTSIGIGNGNGKNKQRQKQKQLQGRNTGVSPLRDGR